MEIEQYKETATIDQSGKVLSVECDGVSSPAGYDFKSVNDWVHSMDRHYEELQWHALGAANAYDALMAEVKQLRLGMKVLKLHAMDMGNDVEIPASVFNLVMDGDLTPPLDP